MLKYLVIPIACASFFSCKTVVLTDGTRITKRQEGKIFEKAFNDSFGKMTDEDAALFEGVSFQVDTAVVAPSERVIQVFSDTSYIEQPSLTLFKELIPSVGDTAITYMDDLIIVNGIQYVGLDYQIWIDYRIVEVYK